MTKGQTLTLLEKIKDECEKHIFICNGCTFFISNDRKCVLQHSHAPNENYEHYKEELQNESNK